ncbi:dTDP-4-amino-4,6-dideoxygalactose transaminase [Algoriphagus sp.]|uniref:dTDP-4-amino-4,6-dideoxygalactose transaminase n=1 Tax=Algoriphagus sp. TaxID=1872435 RepID=UPI003297E85F
MKTPFNKPYQTGKELTYIQDAINRGKISGNGYYTQQCQSFLEKRYGVYKCLLTSSCTDALEMAAILCEIKPGDEVILPSYTFVSTATAFVRRGAQLKFVDSHAEHPMMDSMKLEALITAKTKAILVVHYAGLPCDMKEVMRLAGLHGLFVVEDAAQAIESRSECRQLGTIGHLGTISFHETKNIQCGEGGALLINDPNLAERAEIIWEKGTNRTAFFRGEVDKYGWVDEGSSFLPSEITAAFLWAQLENIATIQDRRDQIWEEYFAYFHGLTPKSNLLTSEYLSLFPKNEKYTFTTNTQAQKANAHIFYLLFESLDQRTRYAKVLKEQGVLAVFHYQSLHRSGYAKKHFPDQYGRELPNAARYSDCLLRLPLFYELPEVIML